MGQTVPDSREDDALECRFGTRGLSFRHKKSLVKACEQVRYAGIRWYRGMISWHSVEPEPPEKGVHAYHWDALDRKLTRILRSDMILLMTIRAVTGWGSGKAKTKAPHPRQPWKSRQVSAFPDPDHVEDYKAFVREVVERYDGDGAGDAPGIDAAHNIKFWQIENEPSGESTENFWNGTAVELARLHAMALNAIRSVDPKARLIAAGFTSGTFLEEMKQRFVKEFLRVLKDSGADFDIFDFHCYKDYATLPGIARDIRRIVKDCGFGRKSIWITETNIDFRTYLKNGVDLYVLDTYNETVSCDTVKRYVTAFASGVEKVFWFTFRDGAGADAWPPARKTKEYTRFRGMVDKDFKPKPVFTTQRIMTSKLDRFTSVEDESGEGYSRFMFRFEKKSPVRVMWSAGKPVPAPIEFAKVKCTDVHGRTSVHPGAELKATDIPVFIEKAD